MKSIRILSLVSVLALASVAQAQTAPTRSTPCSPTTAWNALCVNFIPPTKMADGTDIPSGTVLTYRVEDRLGTGGTFATVPSTLVGLTDLHVQNLAAGVHYVRAYANATGYTESGASNIASRGLTTGVLGAPTITIAVLIEPGKQPLVMDVTAKADGAYRCKLVNVPRSVKVRDNRCSASEG